MDKIIAAIELAESSLLQLFVMVILVEQVTQYAKGFVTVAMKKMFPDAVTSGDELKSQVKLALSFVIAVAICFTFQVKISEEIAINVYLNYLAASIVCAGGSQGWHSLLSFIRAVKSSVESADPTTYIKK